MEINEVTYRIRGCAFEIYNQFGPGLREIIYQRALVHQLRQRGLLCEIEKEVDVTLNGQVVTKQKLDLLVDQLVIVEVKSKSTLLPLDEAQIISYLKVSGAKVGLLINFGSHPIQIKRFIN